MPDQPQQHTLTLSPADQSSFPVIPVDVAPGTARIEVAYAVRAHGPAECVVDIGLRDADGFRGWSGSARRSFFVAIHQATPGYLPGALVPGRWEVVLGAYKVPHDGCTVEVTITLERAQPQWLVGDLHAHSVHSDGQLTLEQLCAMAIGHGLDFLALTDHNTVSQAMQAPRGLPLLLLDGLELTTYRGHANLYGRFCRPFDFRSSDDTGMRRLFDDARAQGALISLNHPFDAGCGWQYSFDLPCDAIEIWNGPWRRHNAAALRYWHEQLVAGRRLIALGGTDVHRLPAAAMHPPVANRIFAAETSVPALLAGLRSGHVVVTKGVTAPCVRFELGGCIVGETATVTGDVAPLLLHVDTSEPCRIRLITDRGVESEYRVAQEAWTLERCVPTGRRFYRVEVWSQEGERGQPLALTNPIFLTTDGP